MKKGLFSPLAVAATDITTRVTPKASRNVVEQAADGLRVYTTIVPEGGKANEAVTKLLAQALGIPKSRLTLVRGATSRDKTFRIS